MNRVKFAVAFGMFLGAIALSGGNALAADSTLINFFSTQCAPCRAMKPILAQLENARVPVRHVDVASEPGLARRYGIRTTPTFVVVAGGKEVTRLVGTHSLDELKAAIAIDPSGPLVPTGAKINSVSDFPAPQTRLAPVRSMGPGHPTFTSAAAPVSAAVAPSEAMPSETLADAVERAEAATVRLRVHDSGGYGTGTGTIIDVHGNEALVLTCGHLFRDTQGKGKIEVDLFVGGETRTVPGQVIDYDAENRDIALVAIQPGFAVQAVQIISPNDQVRTGQTAFSYGCDRGADPSRRDTRITGVDKYNQHLGVSNLEIAGAPIDGRSGGGLFDDRGRLIGVCNAADYQDDVGIYAGPGTIVWQLDRVDLARLYQPSSPPGAAAMNSLAAAPPADRIASLPGATATVLPASAIQPTALDPPRQTVPAAPLQAAFGNDQEVIVIVRDRTQPGAPAKVMTLANPSQDLMRMIQQHAR